MSTIRHDQSSKEHFHNAPLTIQGQGFIKCTSSHGHGKTSVSKSPLTVVRAVIIYARVQRRTARQAGKQASKQAEEQASKQA
jgi:hypothetical protein